MQSQFSLVIRGEHYNSRNHVDYIVVALMKGNHLLRTLSVNV